MLNQTVKLFLIKHKNTIEHVFEKHLKTAFTDLHLDKTGRDSRLNIERTIHGLAHTVRTLAESAVLLGYLRQHEDRHGRPYRFADVNDRKLEQIQVALLFFVTGRKSEHSSGPVYHQYMINSAENFREYASQHLANLYSPEEVDKFARIIAHVDRDACPEDDLMNWAHMVDLVRCKDSWNCQTDEKLSNGFYSPMKTLKDIIGENDAMNMMRYVVDLLAATGEGTQGMEGLFPDKEIYPYAKGGDVEVRKYENRFVACSLNVEECIKAIDSVKAPNLHIVEELKQTQPQPAQAKAQTAEDKLFAELKEKQRLLGLEYENYYNGVYKENRNDLIPQLRTTENQLWKLNQQIEQIESAVKKPVLQTPEEILLAQLKEKQLLLTTDFNNYYKEVYTNGRQNYNPQLVKTQEELYQLNKKIEVTEKGAKLRI